MTRNRNTIRTTKTSRLDAGFTLIELLVAFLLLGFLMSLLYGSFTFANKVTLRTTENSERSFDNYQTLAFLQELLDSIYPEKAVFQGTGDRMVFQAVLNRAGVARGRHLFTLAQAREGDGLNLLLTWRALSPDNMTSGEVVLAEDIGQLELSYHETASSTAPASWLSAWDRDGDLPSLIRIRLAGRGEAATSWPEKVVKIKVTQDVDCLYDPVSRGCRYR